MPRWSRKDTCHHEAELLFLSYGYSVQDTSQVRGGFGDLIVAKHKETIMVELKSKGEKLRPSQQKRWDSWKGHKVVAWSAEEAVEKCEKIVHRRKSL